MRIHPKEHLKHNWQVHELLADYGIEDVWGLPVTLQPTDRFELFQEQFSEATKVIDLKGLAGWLFRLRFFLGGVFHWDEKTEQTNLLTGSIRERYARANGLVFEQLPDPGEGDFIPVYQLEQESLAEIENATVQAAIHLGRVPMDDKCFTVQMTIYVKPKGTFGRMYMWLIKPFRLFIVYPVLLKTIKRQWEGYARATG